MTDQGRQIDDRICILAYGPSRNARKFKGYFANGYKFQISVRGGKQRTTHSGVCVRGSVWSEDESDYYGILHNVNYNMGLITLYYLSVTGLTQLGDCGLYILMG